MSRLIDMPLFNNYYFTMDGNIYDKSNVKKIFPYSVKGKDDLYIDLVNNNGKMESYKCKILFMNIYIGNLPFKIKSLDNTKTNFGSDNLYYDIPDNVIFKFSNPNNKYVVLDNNLVFKRIEKYPSYFISMNGILYGTKRRTFIIPSFDKDGYRFVKLFDPDTHKRVLIRVHRLVYETYNGNIPDSFIVDHYNGDKNCNDLSNLNSISIAANNYKKWTMDCNNSLFDDEIIISICDYIDKGYSVDTIINKLGISDELKPIVYDFCYNLCFTDYMNHITKNFKLYNLKYTDTESTRYSEKQIHEVCKLLESSLYSKPEISKITNIPLSIIKNVAGKHSWKNISCQYNF